MDDKLEILPAELVSNIVVASPANKHSVAAS